MLTNFKTLWILVLIALCAFAVEPAFAQVQAPAAAPISAPATTETPGASEALEKALDDVSGDGAPLSITLQILIVMGLLTILPSIVLMMTSFTRIIIVLSILRHALGLQQTPPNQVLIGLSLFLSLFVMAPSIEQINEQAIAPYSSDQITLTDAIDKSGKIMHSFMAKQTRQSDIKLFMELSNQKGFESSADIPFSIMLPAFVTSELKTAFQIGFLIFLPFLIIDLVVAAVLMALGMMMLSPVIISMPFKLLLFVLVDGWALTMGSLAASFAT